MNPHPSPRTALALLALTLALTPGLTQACGSCRPLVLAGIAAAFTLPAALGMALPAGLMALLAFGLHRLGSRR